MHRATGLCLLALLALSYVAVEAASAPKSACHKLVAVNPANNKKRTVNLDELVQASLTKPFVAEDKAGGWTYEFGICTDITCPDAQPNGAPTPAAACQEATNGNWVLGTYASPPAATYSTAYKKGAIVFNSVVSTVQYNGAPRSSTSTITVICDPKAKIANNITVISAPINSQPYLYQLFLSHRSACGSGGLSGGSICLIILSVLIIVYFVGGFIFLKFARGAEGKEAIPNYEFWSDLPSLCKDGLMFIVNKIRGGGSGGYETVA